MSNKNPKIKSTEQTKEIVTMNMVDFDIQTTAKEDPEVQEKYVFVTTKPVGDKPVPMKCPHCYKDIVSVIDYNISARTHLGCLLIAIFGCILCAPCVYCSDGCRAKEHFCPRCGNFLGSYDG